MGGSSKSTSANPTTQTAASTVVGDQVLSPTINAKGKSKVTITNWSSGFSAAQVKDAAAFLDAKFAGLTSAFTADRSGSTSGGIPVVVPVASQATTQEEENESSKDGKVNNAVLLLGGAAAIVTIFAISKGGVK